MKFLICDHDYKKQTNGTKLRNSLKEAIDKKPGSENELYPEICENEIGFIKLREYVVKNISNIDVLILHYGLDGTLFSKETHPENLVVLYVSSVGRSEESINHGQGRYDIMLRLGFGKVKDWQDVLAPLIDGDAEDICNNTYNDFKEPQRMTYFNYPAMELATSLMIMCQGFLVAYRYLKHPDSIISDSVKEALDFISDSNVPEEILKNISVDAEDLMKPSWWRALKEEEEKEEEKENNLLMTLKKEFIGWKKVNTEIDFERDANNLYVLLKFIHQDEGECKPELVADAFMELKKLIVTS